MRRVIPRERWRQVARSVTFTARKALQAGRDHTAEMVGVAESAAMHTGGAAGMPQPDAMWDFGAAGCEEGILLKIRNLFNALEPGQVLELRSTDPGAREDLPAWCRMTRQEYLGAWGPRYFVRKR